MSLDTALLISGLIFPSISLLSLWGSLHAARKGQHSSPAFIPLLGPLLLTLWMLRKGFSPWAVPLVWVLDVGTLAFLYASPRLIREGWATSGFTRQEFYRGASGKERASLAFHAGGRYVLKKAWSRPRGERGIAALGEPGTYSVEGGVYLMRSDHGLTRRLERRPDGTLRVVSQGDLAPGSEHYSLLHWDFEGNPSQRPP